MDISNLSLFSKKEKLTEKSKEKASFASKEKGPEEKRMKQALEAIERQKNLEDQFIDHSSDKNIDFDDLYIHVEQVRTIFNDKSNSGKKQTIEMLAGSIQVSGLLNPINALVLVPEFRKEVIQNINDYFSSFLIQYKLKKKQQKDIDELLAKKEFYLKNLENSKYYLVCGERRTRAIRDVLKRDSIQVTFIKANSLKDIKSIQLLENVSREDLELIEIQKSVYDLKKQGYKNKEIAKSLGKDVGSVSRLYQSEERHRKAIKEITDEIEKNSNKKLTINWNDTNFLNSLGVSEDTKVMSIFARLLKTSKTTAINQVKKSISTLYGDQSIDFLASYWSDVYIPESIINEKSESFDSYLQRNNVITSDHQVDRKNLSFRKNLEDIVKQIGKKNVINKPDKNTNPNKNDGKVKTDGVRKKTASKKTSEPTFYNITNITIETENNVELLVIKSKSSNSKQDRTQKFKIDSLSAENKDILARIK